MEIILDGPAVRSEAAFHDVFDKAARSVGFEGYGRNRDALWDLIAGIFPRPSCIRWSKAKVSREALGPSFDGFVDVLREVERELGPGGIRLQMEC